MQNLLTGLFFKETVLILSNIQDRDKAFRNCNSARLTSRDLILTDGESFVPYIVCVSVLGDKSAAQCRFVSRHPGHISHKEERFWKHLKTVST